MAAKKPEQHPKQQQQHIEPQQAQQQFEQRKTARKRLYEEAFKQRKPTTKATGIPSRTLPNRGTSCGRPHVGRGKGIRGGRGKGRGGRKKGTYIQSSSTESSESENDKINISSHDSDQSPVINKVDRQKDRKAKDQEKVEKEKDQEKVELENNQEEEEKEKVEKEKDQEKEEKEKDQEDVEKDVTQEKEETHYEEVLQDDSFLYAATLTEELGYPIVQDLLQLQMNTEEGILEFEATDISKDDEIKVGQYVAVAYESEWFAGLVVEKVDDTFKINFMKKISTGNDFKWTAKGDTSCVRKEFIFETNVEVVTKDSYGRIWHIKEYKEIQNKFQSFCKNFFTN